MAQQKAVPRILYHLIFHFSSNYASAAVIIAIEYTSPALHPRDKSLIGAFNPSKIGPYASKLPIRCAIL